MSRSSRIRCTGRTLLGALTAPAALGGLLFVEGKLTKRGTQLPDLGRFEHNGRVGGAGEALRMVWLGDSTAAGAGASSADTSLPRLVAAGLDRPVELTVLAVSGARIHDVAVSQVAPVPGLRPDVVLITVGTNDVIYRTPTRAFQGDYERVLAALPEEAVVVVLGAGVMGEAVRLLQPLRALAGWRGRSLDAVIRAAAAARGASFVDIARAAGPAIRRDPGRLLAVDRLHPSEQGYRLWAEAVLEVLRPALVTRGFLPDGPLS